MNTVIERLRAVRERHGLSQAEVAARVGTSQSAVARLEAGRVDPRLGTAERHARALGMRIEAVDADTRPSVVATAGAVGDAVAADGADEALRHVIQLLDDLRVLPPELVREVLRIDPGHTRSRRWDALLAAACERAAHEAGIEAPGWTASPSRFLDELWFPSEDILGWFPVGLACSTLASSPPEFAIRGVFIDPATLESA
ncbi:MAG TPA: helix-turn-helix domain-containing protein [Nitriliruptorales bacterium]